MNRPIRLAVFFDQQLLSGGGYQQSITAALETLKLSDELVEVIFFTPNKENIFLLKNVNISFELIQFTFIERLHTVVRRSLKNSFGNKIFRKIFWHSPFEKKLNDFKIDLVYFVSPSNWSYDLDEINFILTVWDFCHRDNPEFPEVRWNREFENRDFFYSTQLPKAISVFVDSELAKINSIKRYNLDEERIFIMLFQASSTIIDIIKDKTNESFNILKKYDLELPYIFYPAQFWAHKNHVYILQGLYLLEKIHGIKIAAIFSGADKGNLMHIKKYAENLGLLDNLRFVGFVSTNELIELYRQSIALVMPTYFGPTNIPPLEAFQLGVPVLYSDKIGLRDQVGKAALLMDLTDPNSMASHIKNLIINQDLRDNLIQNGYERLKILNPEENILKLNLVLQRFQNILVCWR
jgi:glycosyltransferase involved in cell wall biosynthesis